MSRWMVLSAVLALAIGCGDSRERLPLDAGGDSGTDATSSDASNADASDVDASEEPDAGSETDSGGPPPEGGIPMPDAGGFDGGTPVIQCPGVATPCTSGCTTGEACISNLCGAMICAQASAFCESAADCHGSSTCASTARGNLCQPSNGEVCNDARDCPAGHECEGVPGSRACVSRRIPCELDEICPLGYECGNPTQGDGAFCVFLHRGCDDGKVCSLSSGGCVDVDGDGDTECAPSGGCTVSSGCTAPLACIFDSESAMGGACVASGLCDPAASGDCGSGLSCLDLRNEGLGQCAATGACTTHTDCGAHGVCGIASGTTTPACLSGL